MLPSNAHRSLIGFIMMHKWYVAFLQNNLQIVAHQCEYMTGEEGKKLTFLLMYPNYNVLKWCAWKEHLSMSKTKQIKQKFVFQ